MEYRVPYGKGEQVVDLPEEHVSQVLLPPVIDKPRTVEELMEEALARPIGTPTLDQLVKAGLKHILAVLRVITDLPDGKHNDELHILKWFFFCFSYSEPERSDISGDKIKVELFTEITYVLQIAIFLFAVKQNAVFSASFAVRLLFGNHANGGFDFGIQGSKR